MTTVREIFDRMPQTFLKEQAAGMDAVIQFDITGDGGVSGTRRSPAGP